MHSLAAIAAALILTLPTASSLGAQVVPPGRPPAQMPAGPGRILGKALSMEGQPLQAVAITVRSAADSSLVTGALTNKDGRFLIENLPFGQYTLRVSLVGYKPRNSEVISLTAQSLSSDLGDIKLDVLPIELKAVEAVGERSAVVVEADRTVYNTKQLPQASTGNAIDVLRSLPELEVDVNDNVKLRGNQSVAIHLNGRPAPLRGEQLANFLKQLPGNRLARVEVMPNPSARHDPEGMGGIVNIVLRENLDLGLSGSINANGSTQNRNALGGRINYQRGRLTLFTGLSLNVYEQDSRFWDLRENLAARPVTSIMQNSTSNNDSRGGWGDWTAELKVGRQATLWSNSWINFSTSTNSGQLKYEIMDEASALRDSYDRLSENEFTYGSLDVGLGFKQIFTQMKHELTIDGRINSGVNDTESRLTKDYLMANGAEVDLPIELTHNDIDAGNGNLSLQADYFRPLGKGRFDIGLRVSRRGQDDDNLLRIFASEAAPDPREQTRSGYDYEEQFNALYGLYGVTIGKFSAQAGLRAELTSTHFTSLVNDSVIDRDYQSVFPSFNIAYTPKQGRTVRFLYSKSIGRPSAYHLNAFVPTTDPLNRFIGNPRLRASYSHSFRTEFSWTGNKGTIRVAPYYRRAEDLWERIRRVDTLGVATSTWENAASSQNYGSNFSLSMRPTGRLNGSANFSVYREVRDGSNIQQALRRDAIMWSLGGYFGYKVQPTLSATVNAHYMPPQNILQGRASGYTFTSLGLRQMLWGTKGSISLNVNDPLALQKYNSDTRDITYRQTSRSSYQSRVATLGFNWNFGKPPQQQSRRSGDEAVGETIRVR